MNEARPSTLGLPRGDEAGRAAVKWREALFEHGRHVWRAAPQLYRADDATLLAVEPALGALTGQAIELVAAFALGRRHLVGSAGVGQPGDLAGLDIILDGLAESAAALPPLHRPPRGQVIQSELWQVLHKVRESAELAYSRQLNLVELDRRILFMLQSMGPLVPAEVAGAVGVDKAQVSRSVKRLLDQRIVEREQIRSPLRLTRKGEALGKRLLRLAEFRNGELTYGIGEAELSAFFAEIEVLLDRAMVLYERERDLAAQRADGVDSGPERRAERIVIDRSRIVSPLLTLSAYFSRSGALAFKRLTGLSNFEAFVLSEIGIAPPVAWGDLVANLQRDHSQASRTVKTLMDRGLVTRDGKPGRRHGRFAPSEQGARLHKVIHDAGRERSAFLLAPLDDDRRERFLSMFDKLRRNAGAQLDRERAMPRPPTD